MYNRFLLDEKFSTGKMLKFNSVEQTQVYSIKKFCPLISSGETLLGEVLSLRMEHPPLTKEFKQGGII